MCELSGNCVCGPSATDILNSRKLGKNLVPRCLRLASTMKPVFVLKFLTAFTLCLTFISGMYFLAKSSEDAEIKEFNIGGKVKVVHDKLQETAKDAEGAQPPPQAADVDNPDAEPAPEVKVEHGPSSTEVATTKSPSTKEPLKDNAHPPSIQIFYYPWYGNIEVDGKWFHWNHKYIPHWSKTADGGLPPDHSPPADIGANFYPQLGPYSSRDNNTIERHMKWISAAGIDVVVVSWYPPEMSDDQGIPWDTLMPTLLEFCDKFKLKLAFHLEPYKTRTAESVRKDLLYIIDNYGKHPALYRMLPKRKPVIQGKSDSAAEEKPKELPLFYVYDSYLVDTTEWKRIATKEGDLTIRGTDYDSVLLGLMVKEEDRNEIQQSGFDGMYTYFAADGFSYGSKMSNWPALSEFCRKNDLIFSPSVGPGYDDRRVRPWNGVNRRERQNGVYYKEHFKMAHTAKADIVSITSFNEWHEGTQIEPAIAFKDANVTKYEYIAYDKGPEQYLEITLEMVKTYFTAHHENIPMQIERIV
uniref:Glycoprotein endo-alpha-1,2-mannosidase n=1 Tax=Steinernema glaseri TaxID=37863 RepID=A0A1I7ZZT1_9BILA